MTNEFLKDQPELEKMFDRLQSAPDSHVFAPLADSCRKIGRLEEALEICETGVEKHPEYASGYVVLGKCHYDREEKDQARTAFQKVLSLDENNLVALKYLGMILVEHGDQAAAMEHFKHILALDPDNLEIRSKLENLQQQEIETADSEPESEESDEDEEIILLDEILDDDFEGEPIRLGSEKETSDELATLTLADIYASQGYVHKAKGIYEEVLRKWPDHSQAKEKLAALELEKNHLLTPDDDRGAPDEIQAAEVMDSPPISVEQHMLDSDAEQSPAGDSLESGKDEADPDADEKPNESSVDIEKFKKWIERMSD
jgi:tetratricopeptide (TPR) repeat protein